MGKLKFYLNYGGQRIRTLEELQNNFLIEDILDDYKSGKFQRWLSAWNYRKELKQINSIRSSDDVEIAKVMLRIFEIPGTEKEIQEILSPIKVKTLLADIQNSPSTDTTEIIERYFSGYEKLVSSIVENCQDMALCQKLLQQLVSKYDLILKIDYQNLIKRFISVAPNVLSTIVATQALSTSILRLEAVKQQATRKVHSQKSTNFEELGHIVSSMDKDIKIYQGNTHGKWVKLEPAWVKVEVTYSSAVTRIRSPKEYAFENIYKESSGKVVFAIWGLEYMSNSDDGFVTYKITEDIGGK